MKTQEFDNNSPCPLEEVMILLRLTHSMSGIWCVPSASWDTAALFRLLWIPGNSSSLPITWEAWLCACCLLSSAAHHFLPDSKLMFAVPLPQDLSVQILPGKEQYSQFPSCPAVRARKRDNSPFYCPTTPSKRYTPRKTVLYLEIMSCQQTKSETSCCKTEKEKKKSLCFVLLK